MSRRLTLLLLIATLLWPAAARAFSPEGYPGSTWGNLSREFEGLEGSGSQGNVTQGIQWLTLPGGLPLTTYGFYRWRARTQNRTYYNAFGPGAGVSLTKGPVDFGAEFYSERYPELHETTNDTDLYVRWYKKIDLTASVSHPNLFGLRFLGAPLSSWGRLADDFNGIEGRSTDGWISQGIDWYKLPGDVLVSTLGTFYWRIRSNNRQYYNDYAPALGLNFNWKWFDLLAESRWDTYPDYYQQVHDYRVFLTWYYAWDLKKLR